MNRAERRCQQKKAKKLIKKTKRFQSATPAAAQQNLRIKQDLDLAVEHHNSGRLTTAKSLYQQILDVDPRQPVALHLLGVIAQQKGESNKAVDLISQALALNPDLIEAHNNLGLVLQELGKLDEAVASYLNAIAIEPHYAVAHYNLGNALKDLGKRDEAATSFRKAIAIKPDYTEAHNSLGLVFQELSTLEKAVESHLKALSINPNYAQAHYNLGNALKGLGKLDEAVTSFQKALAIKPDYNQALNNLGTTFKTIGKLDEAIASFSKALSVSPDDTTAHCNLVLTEQYQTEVTLEKLNAVHAEWDKQHGIPLRSEWLNHENSPDPDKTLRIGFVSPNFGRHPVGYFVINLLERKPAGEFEFICYSDRQPDEFTERLRAAADEWVDVRGVSDAALSERIRSDRIDILIDLSGHMAKSKLLVFARKPAPIQVKWVGYAGSVGLSAIDYLIADEYHIPEGVEREYLEKIIRLPDGYVSYQPPDYAPEVGPLPCKENDFITFGCFNNPAKINDLVLSTWGEILQAVPNSRLILKYKSMDAEANCTRILNKFKVFGIEASRVTFEGKASHRELLARYNEIDIALDTFPYTGGLTTCEAIWMGVPVITKSGETFASRHSLSHLTNVGVPEFVASDLQDYVTKTLELANDTSRLVDLRSGLRDQMASSVLCDGALFARGFASAMRHIWKQWCLIKDH